MAMLATRTRARWMPVLLLVLLAAALPLLPARAAPEVRVQVTQRGDVLLIGNTLGQECVSGTPTPPIPAPVVGAVGACGASGIGDSAPDVFWRSDSPAPGQAEANTTVSAADARSTAVLALPPGANVTHAYLYWGAARTAAGGPVEDTSATIARPGAFSQELTAIESWVATNANLRTSYQSVADVTELVQAQGSGAYQIGGVDADPFVGISDNDLFAAWWMAVIYELPSEPLRNIALFDSLEPVGSATPQEVTLQGFLVPNSSPRGELSVIAYEGDAGNNGDQILLNNAVLSNALNPSNNFFNGTRSELGGAVSLAGDLPQLTGGERSMSGIDLDTVDVTGQLPPGATSAVVEATSSGDNYLLGGFVTSFATIAPDFTGSPKTATDINGGQLRPGDEILYQIALTNSGNDASASTVLSDPLPAGVSYMPGSIQIGAAAQTDQPGDDQAEYNPGSNTITARLGGGANAISGGSIAVGQTVTVELRVRVNAAFSGVIANQALLSAAGQQGATASVFRSDGNGAAAGSPPTVVVVPGVRISQSGGSTAMVEGGSDSYSVALASVPAAEVQIQLQPASAKIDLGAGPGQVVTLTFQPNASALTAQTVTVTAVDNAIFDPGTVTIAHTAFSNDPRYDSPGTPFSVDGAATNIVTVTISDDEPTPTSTPTGTATRTASPTATRTATGTATSSPTRTATRTASPTVTGTGTATRTATGTATSSPTRTATRTASPTVTGTRTATVSPTATRTSVPTATRTASPTTTPPLIYRYYYPWIENH